MIRCNANIPRANPPNILILVEKVCNGSRVHF